LQQQEGKAKEKSPSMRKRATQIVPSEKGQEQSSHNSDGGHESFVFSALL